MTAFGNFAQHGAHSMRLLRVPVSSVYEEAELLLPHLPSRILHVYDIYIYNVQTGAKRQVKRLTELSQWTHYSTTKIFACKKSDFVKNIYKT